MAKTCSKTFTVDVEVPFAPTFCGCYDIMVSSERWSGLAYSPTSDQVVGTDWVNFPVGSIRAIEPACTFTNIPSAFQLDRFTAVLDPIRDIFYIPIWPASAPDMLIIYNPATKTIDGTVQLPGGSLMGRGVYLPATDEMIFTYSGGGTPTIILDCATQTLTPLAAGPPNPDCGPLYPGSRAAINWLYNSANGLVYYFNITPSVPGVWSLLQLDPVTKTQTVLTSGWALTFQNRPVGFALDTLRNQIWILITNTGTWNTTAYIWDIGTSAIVDSFVLEATAYCFALFYIPGADRMVYASETILPGTVYNPFKWIDPATKAITQSSIDFFPWGGDDGLPTIVSSSNAVYMSGQKLVAGVLDDWCCLGLPYSFFT